MIAAKPELVLERPGSIPVTVKEYDPVRAEAWDRWVSTYPGATPFHTSAWIRSLERTFGYSSRSIYAERDGEVTGVLPLFLISNWIRGRCLMSSPFADYGGICAGDGESAAALLECAKQMAVYEEVDYLELRHRSYELQAGFIPQSLYVAFSCELGQDAEAEFRKLPRDTRYMIRKGEKAGLEVESGTASQMESFYKLLATSWRRLGTPMLPKKWLYILVEEFGQASDLKLVYHRGKAVAGVLSLSCGDSLFPHYAGAAPEANQVAANNFMYWQLMREAMGKGMRRFDFGRSKRDTGAFQFKSSWNMQLDTLDYQTLLVRRKEVPDISPLNPKFRIATRLWSCMPLGATMLLGPKLIRLFP
jgi:FemAB-related protein (PEP-CTERM system-associated)